MSNNEASAARSLRIAILATCFNRAEVSLIGIGSLKRALALVESVEPRFFIVDDASPDDTGRRLREAFPDLVVALGTGGLFWAGGMRRAYALAREHGSFDAYLLFNDDVDVDPEALTAFFAEYRQLNAEAPAILVGATTSKLDGALTYSTMRRLGTFTPLRVQKMALNGALQPCDTFNANFVLVPGSFFDKVGGLDPTYIQSYADIDLGYAATRAGVPPYLASTPIGWCEGHLPSEHTPSGLAALLGKLGASWGKQDSIRQRTHFMLKNVPFPLSIPVAGISAARMVVGWAAHWLKRR